MISKKLITALFYLFLVQQGASGSPVVIPLVEKVEPVRIGQGAERRLSVSLPEFDDGKMIQLSWKERIVGEPVDGVQTRLRVYVNDTPVSPADEDRGFHTMNDPPVITDFFLERSDRSAKNDYDRLSPAAQVVSLPQSGMLIGGSQASVSFKVDITDLVQVTGVNQIVFRHSVPGPQGAEEGETDECSAVFLLEDIVLKLGSPRGIEGSPSRPESGCAENHRERTRSRSRDEDWPD